MSGPRGILRSFSVCLALERPHSRPIPIGWGYDRDGNDTTDAGAVIDGGALAPTGGYKGMLLGLLVDLLAGVLSGPNCSFEAPVFRNHPGKRDPGSGKWRCGSG